MFTLIDAAVSRTRTPLLIMCMILIAGCAPPDVDLPFIEVVVISDGISPLDAERLLTRPLEDELKFVEGVESLMSSSSRNIIRVKVNFDAEYDLDVALFDVREAVNRAKPELPETTEEPIITVDQELEVPEEGLTNFIIYTGD